MFYFTKLEIKPHFANDKTTKTQIYVFRTERDKKYFDAQIDYAIKTTFPLEKITANLIHTADYVFSSICKGESCYFGSVFDVKAKIDTSFINYPQTSELEVFKICFQHFQEKVLRDLENLRTFTLFSLPINGNQVSNEISETVNPYSMQVTNFGINQSTGQYLELKTRPTLMTFSI